MNDLERYFRANDKRLIHKWLHYFDVYDRHFSRFRGKDPVVLEIGVAHGGSLQMWKDYFGKSARIYGIDVNPACQACEEDNIRIFIGSQADRGFLREITKKIPPIDILIDDGGHSMRQQIVTFEELFDHVKPDGVYLCEDVHTSYWLNSGGGHKRRGTFIEYCKNLIDRLNAYHSEQKSLTVTDFTRAAGSIHFYDSIVVIEKQARERPTHEMTGIPTLDTTGTRPSKYQETRLRTINGMLTVVNTVLRAFRLPGFIYR